MDLYFSFRENGRPAVFKPLDPPHMASPPKTRLTESASSREVSRKEQAVSPPEWAQSVCVSMCGILRWQKNTSCAVQVGGHMEVVWRSHLRENLHFWDQGLQRTPGVAERAVEKVLGAWGRRGGCCCTASPAWCIYLQGGSRRGVGCDGASTGSVARSPRDAEAAVAGLIVIPWEDCEMSPIVLANPFLLKYYQCSQALKDSRISDEPLFVFRTNKYIS